MLYIYKASAGSGKTYTLAREFICLLLEMPAGTLRPHSHILAVTFTKKATAEMKERILRELYTIATAPDDSPYLKDKKFTGRIHLSPSELQGRARELLNGILQDYSGFAVNTIDGFFQQVLRSFARESGLPAQYDLTLDGEQVITQAVDDLLFRLNNKQLGEDTGNWLTDLVTDNIADSRRWNPREQLLGISRQLLTERLQAQLHAIRHLLTNKQLLRTYRGALHEIVSNHITAVKELQAEALRQIEGVGTEGFNSIILRPFSTPAEELMNRGLSLTFVKCVQGESNCYKKTAKNRGEIEALWAKSLGDIFRQLHDRVQGDGARDYFTAQLILDNLSQLGLLSDIAEQIQLTNREQNRLPISEVNSYLSRIIDHSDAPFIYEKTGARIRHYMIDEFQDTSAMQWDNFRPLIENANSQGQQNLIVGDVKQSIYRWRNGDWHILANVDKQVTPCEQPPMGTNYRSSHVIVDFNNELFGQYSATVANKLDAEFGVGSGAPVHEAYSPQTLSQQAHKMSLAGFVQMQFFEEDAAERALQAMLPLLESLHERGFALGETAVLVRTRREAQQVCTFLLENGYDVQSAEGLRIAAHPAVQLLTCLLQLSINPDDEILQARARLLTEGRDLSEAPEALLSRVNAMPLYEQVQEIIDTLHLTEWGDAAATYITAFQDLVYTYVTTQAADVPAFLDWWGRQADKAGVPAPRTHTAIQVLTVHASKGLEFEAVFIPFLSWDIAAGRNDSGSLHWYIPSRAPFDAVPLVPVAFGKNMRKSWFSDEYMHEMLDLYMDNMNLTYVAFTRPVRELYIFGEACPTGKEPANVGHLLHSLYGDSTRGAIAGFGEREKPAAGGQRPAQYISRPVGERLHLRTRAQSADPDEDLSPVAIGTLMHDWLGQMRTLDQADSLLQRMVDEGRVSARQRERMQEQMQVFRKIVDGRHWFDPDAEVLLEKDILTPGGNIYRPDRVVLREGKAEVIDYKFGHERRHIYREQVRNYMQLLERIGYRTEGWLVYVTLESIDAV